MPKPDAIADHLCELITGLTKHRQGRGPHWIAVSTIARELRKEKVPVSAEDLEAAIALCVERHVLKTAGDPVHSIAPWQKDWKL